MSVTGLSAEGEVESSLSTRKPPHTRLYVLLGILFALLAGVFMYLLTYAPLYALGGSVWGPQGSVVWPAAGSTESPVRAAQLVRLTGLSPNLSWLKSPDGGPVLDSPKPGTTFGYGNAIASNGPIPVKIVSVEASFVDGKSHTVVSVRLADQRPVIISLKDFSPSGQPVSGVMKFVPYTLTANTRPLRTIGVEFTVPKCADRMRSYGTNSVVWLESYSVTYKYLWFTRKAMIVGVPPHLALVAPYDCGTATK